MKERKIGTWVGRNKQSKDGIIELRNKKEEMKEGREEKHKQLIKRWKV